MAKPKAADLHLKSKIGAEFHDSQHIDRLDGLEQERAYDRGEGHFLDRNELFIANQQHKALKRELLRSLDFANEHIGSNRKVYAGLSPGYQDTR